MSNGIIDPVQLLAEMEPQLAPGLFVFVHVPAGHALDLAALDPVGTFRETEGLTLILSEDKAREHGLAGGTPLRQITLDVHSSLEAVGLTAAVSGELARNGIAANVVAAFYHDHIFVPATDAEKALRLLRELSAGSRQNETRMFS
ncbi:ACT domain-containing protein [Rhizobium sp. S95]|uniref:ACT domain-containing protein n=1 Tax=Ciceribacter sichuanensis TaxID=2949647 RepID=A0AAJ1BUU7_9HYPH|nr:MULTISPECIES: ACT domain-containing protein [unclassified Ciceribacter]MCM2399007.1 ACT domain-containing protein [Ciceribacter sp. S95]MCO5956787.1 ACT domain-containing protein [Ciceribacter sp. S101]